MHRKDDAAEFVGDKRDNFTNRQFVTLVRAELAAMERRDVAVERNWIEEDEPGYPFLLLVPVGNELIVPLKAMDGFFHTRTDEDRSRHAREFAKAMVNLKSAEKMLEKYARDVRRAANTAVAAAREDGLDILVEKVGFKPSYACHLTNPSWKEAALHILAAVTIRHTSLDLRPETSELWVEKPTDVATELVNILESQRERQARILELDELGADLVVDQITLDLLEAHGLNATEILRGALKQRHTNLKVQHLGKEVSLTITNCQGAVTASIMLEDAFWNGETFWLVGDEQANDHAGLVGKSLDDLVRHPVFTARPIATVEHRGIEQFTFNLSDKLMFDADTGRIWREERLAA